MGLRVTFFDTSVATKIAMLCYIYWNWNNCWL